MLYRNNPYCSGVYRALARAIGFSLPFAVLFICIFFTSEILQASTPPTISIMSPSSPVALNINQSKTFNIEASASAGLKGIEWFVGSSSKKYTSYTNTWDYYQQESWSTSFSSAGTYYVYAYVYDRDTTQREALVYWRVNVTNPIPNPPSGVSATDGTYTDRVRVTWNSVSNATHYRVYRATSSSGSKSAVSSWQTSRSFDDTSATSGSTYYYFVRSATSSSGANASGYSSYNTGYASIPTPNPPGGVDATDGTYTDKVRVSWNSASYATHYRVYRATSSSGSKSAVSSWQTSRTYDDTSVTRGTTYYYFIRSATSSSGANASSYSSYNTGYASLPTPPAISITSPNSPITLNVDQAQTFNAEAEAASGIKGIEWFVGSASKKYTSYTASWDYYQQESWTTSFDTAGTYYVYAYVYDRETVGREALVTWRVDVVEPTPDPPGGVTATDGTYTDKVRITWNSASNATHYRVYRASTSTGSKSAISPWQSALSFDDSSAAPGTTYYYFVSAATSTSGANESGYSTYNSGYAQLPDAPEISIMSPSTPVALETGQSQLFNIQAEAASGIKGIEWFVGASSKKYTSYIATWDYYQQESWTTSFDTAGTYYVHAYVYDRETAGREAFVTWQVIVTDPPPPDPPAISIMSPVTPVALKTGQTQIFNIEAEAASGIKGIEWFVGASSKKYTPYTATWDYYQQESWTTSFDTAGTYYVHAYVYDRETAGREAFVTWQINVVTPPPPDVPSISIMSPSSPVPLQIGQEQVFNIEAEAASGIKGIEWYVGASSKKYTSYTNTWDYYQQESWSTSFNEAGTYYVHAYVYDREPAGREDLVTWKVVVAEPVTYTFTSLKGMVSSINSFGGGAGPLPGATVELVGVGTHTTGSDGKFAFDNFAPGSYTIEVNKSSYYPETRQVELASGSVHSEIITLKAESTTPVTFGFESSTGTHVISGMPGMITFDAKVAWNGSPGSARFFAAGEWHNAVTSDLGNGIALAEVSMPRPGSIETCSELTIEVTNGEGEKTTINAGVHFYPGIGLIPWYEDNILWTPSEVSIGYTSKNDLKYKLPIPSDDFQLEAKFGYASSINYDILGATFTGSLAGSGGMDFTIPTPQPGLKILGGAQIGLKGAIKISMAGCGDPSVSSSWTASYSGKAGIEAPAVLVIDAIAPGVGTTLGSTPFIKDIKLKLFQKVGGSISGKYKSLDGGDCFLGADSLSGKITGGPEATALVDFKKVKTKAGVYVGGDGTFGIGICPDFKMNDFTGRLYAGAFAESFGFKAKTETAAEITWDFNAPVQQAKVLAFSRLGDVNATATWEPIGNSPEQWGEPNKLSRESSTGVFRALSKAASSGFYTELIIENVINGTSPSVFADGQGAHILYARHDTNKAWYAATDIGVVDNSTGVWVPYQLTDNQTAEFHPQIRGAGNNSLFAAWTRAVGDVSGVQSPEEVAPHLEIVFSHYDSATAAWSTPAQLTDNLVVDRDPLPITIGSKQAILWVQNEGPLLAGDATYGDALMYREWTGVAWSIPVQLLTGKKAINSFSFVNDATGEGYVVCSVDVDGDNLTVADGELFELKTVGGVWQPATRLTDDVIEDSLPILLSTDDGSPLLVWKAGGNMQYSTLTEWNPKQVYSEYTLSGESPSLDGVTMPGGAAIAYTVQSAEGIDIVATFYDSLIDQWSLPRQITADEDAESSLSMTYNGTQLVIAYLKTQTLRETIEVEINGRLQEIANTPQPGRTDLYALTYALGNDPALLAESIAFSPVNPAPGSSAGITVQISNLGDKALENVPVAFYEGAPDQGGRLIGETTISGFIVPGELKVVEMEWLVPEIGAPHQINVVIDPRLTIEDRNRNNNVAVHETVLPDLSVLTADHNQISLDTIILTAQIQNTGVIPSGSFDVSWHLSGPDGPEIARATIADVLPGTRYDAVAQWNLSEPVQPEHFVPLYIVIDPINSIVEFNEENNVGLQSVRTPLYTAEVGTLTVILPAEAVSAGVKWSIDEGASWNASGTTLNLLPGTYTITFSTANGWSLPAIHNVNVILHRNSLLAPTPENTGDINGDNIVDLMDAIISLQLISGGPLGSQISYWYDINDDDLLGLHESIDIIRTIANDLH